MPLPTIAGVVRAAARGTLPTGTGWINVLHCQYAGGASTPGTVEIDNLHALLVRIWNGTAFTGGSAWFAYCRNTVQLNDITYYVLNGVAPAYVKTITVQGTQTAQNSLPQEVAPVVTIRTNTRGKRYRGRIYLPPCTINNVDNNGNLNGSVVDAVKAQFTGLQSALAAVQWTIGVASYGKGMSNGVPTTWTPFYTPAASFTMDIKPDVQRRRK